MLKINKNYVMDTNKKPVAVQISIADFEKIEEILEDYWLVQMIHEVKDDETIDKEEALSYLESLKIN